MLANPYKKKTLEKNRGSPTTKTREAQPYNNKNLRRNHTTKKLRRGQTTKNLRRNQTTKNLRQIGKVMQKKLEEEEEEV